MNTGQRGNAMLVVLILLSVMLLGGLALARITETSTLAAGNSAYRTASLHAAEVGLNTGYMAAQAITAAAENDSIPGWYWPTMQTTDASGIPTVNFDAAPEVQVGNHSVRYVVERMCDTAVVTDAMRQCLVVQDLQLNSQGNDDLVDPTIAKQFRITVRVDGPKGTQTWTQMLVTKG